MRCSDAIIINHVRINYTAMLEVYVRQTDEFGEKREQFFCNRYSQTAYIDSSVGQFNTLQFSSQLPFTALHCCNIQYAYNMAAMTVEDRTTSLLPHSRRVGGRNVANLREAGIFAPNSQVCVGWGGGAAFPRRPVV